jgi:hypothetical protein
MAAAPDDPNLTAPPQAATPPGAATPSPAAAPTPKAGNHLLAQVHVQTAMKVLQGALGLYPDSNSKEYKTLLEVMKKMVSTFGAQSEAQSLVPAEVLQMVRSVQQQGSAPVNPQQ